MAIPPDVQAAIDRLDGGYNNTAYNASTNPLGFSAGGHRINLYALTADMVLVGDWLADQAGTVTALEDELTAVTAITAQLTALAAIDDDIVALAAISAGITALAAIAANITTVANNSASVTAVAAIAAAVSTVAGISGNVTSVAGIAADVTSLNGIKAALQALGAITAAISTVAGIDDDVVTLAAIAASVVAVAGMGSDVQAVAANLADIQAAIAAAAAAVEARNQAQTYRDQAAGYVASARAVGLFFGFSDVTSDGDPGAGLFRLDNADPALAETMFISTTAVGGGDVEGWIDGWDNSTTLDRRGEITLIDAVDASTWFKFRIVGANENATGYRKVQIELVAASGALANGEEYGFTVVTTGNTGSGDGDVVGGDVSVEGNAAVFTDDSGKSIGDGGPIALSGMIETKTDNYTIVGADRGKTLIANRATAIQFSIVAVDTLPGSFTVIVKNRGAGPLTIDPDGAEQIEGVATVVLTQGQSCVISREGGAFRTLLRSPSLDDLHRTGDDIASAATVNLESATGAFVEVTGTTATTAITLADGHQRLVRAAGAWPLTHGTNLQLPGGANYTCAAGDMIHFVADGSVIRATIFPVSGQPAVRVANAKLAQVATATIKGRRTAGTGDVEDLTVDQARLVLQMPGLLRGFLSGLGTSNSSTSPNTKIDVATGVAIDDGFSSIITLAAGTIDFATTGANGLDTGTLAASTTYHLFAIAKADGTTARLASLSPTAPTLPSGYTLKRRIWSVLTNASGNLVAYHQFGNTCMLDVPVSSAVHTNPGTDPVLVSLSVPNGIVVEAVVSVYLLSGDTTRRTLLLTSPLQTASAPAAGSMSSLAAGVAGGAAANGSTQAEFRRFTNTSRQVRYELDGSGAATFVFVNTIGWVDAI
jgi:hypothetical protein